MNAEIVPVPELSAARKAFGRMDGHVLVEGAHAGEGSVAHHAHVCVSLGG